VGARSGQGASRVGTTAWADAQRRLAHLLRVAVKKRRRSRARAVSGPGAHEEEASDVDREKDARACALWVDRRGGHVRDPPGRRGHSIAPGVLIIPLEREFGWTRATVSFAVSINLFLYGLSGPFIAGLMDRLGIRRVMVTSLALVATGVALTTLMTASWQLALLWGVVVGLGTGTMASVLGALVANRWFTERRGVVLGLLTASSATGQLLFLPLLASMVVRFGCEAPCCWWPASRSSFCRWWPC